MIDVIVTYILSNFDTYSNQTQQLSIRDNQSHNDLVPNYVHYVLFSKHEIEFSHFICMLSVLKNQRPDRIYIHCDCNQIEGQNYQRLAIIANITNTPIIVRPVVMPTQVFGQPLSTEYGLWHASDIMRLQVLREFGGIYLDRDVYVIHPLNEFFKYDMTLDFDKPNILGNQVLIGK